MNLGEVLVDQGRPAEADILLSDVAGIFRASGSRFDFGLCLAFRGRASLRDGRLEEAFGLLESAREELEAAGAHSDALEVEARVAEALLFVAEPERALERSTDLLARLQQEEGIGHVTSILHRVRGYALTQLGATSEAREAFAASLAAAREKEADYEVALALQALLRLSALDGLEPPPGASEECSSILRGLGVVAVPAPPIRSPGAG